MTRIFRVTLSVVNADFRACAKKSSREGHRVVAFSDLCHEDQIIVHVSPRALDRAFAATDPLFYASVVSSRVKQLMAMPADERIRAPVIGATEGRLVFKTGRHRARAALLQGHKVLPVIVDKDNVAEVRKLLARFKQ